MMEMLQLGDTSRQTMGEQARTRVFADYSIEKAVDNTVKAAFDLLDSRREGARH
jgi:hypothetical protein